MSHDTASPSRASIDRVVETVAALPGVGTAPHRFGGTEFTLRGRELGHVHADGYLDISYPRAVRDALVAEGWTGPHHLYPDSGWTTFHLTVPANVAHATALVTLSYLWHAAALSKRHADVPAPDTEGELARLDAPASVRRLFAR
ncbi:luciferase family protein [Halosegnis marinus]|uniref:Luciferase family protein n=1 Tax=Halosegnis marinus TaxID=3034023 RepID=A0ABD5ZP97_9EURY|nr:luciferase family protein [Halosegnis sp. DT85]